MPFVESMPYRRVGQSGLKVSAFGLGGWTTYGGTVEDKQTVREILLAAYEAGINFFDIADVYAKGASETAMGAVLSELPRHELVITSKVFWPMSDDVNDRGLSRKHIMESVEKSLKRIGTDYLDMYFCHRFDPETPVEETVRAMDDLVRQGKILYWGTSEWTGAQLFEAQRVAEKRNADGPVVEQPQYSLLARHKFETDVVPATQKLGMGNVVWSPLGSGVLTGKYDDGIPEGSRLSHMEWLRELVMTDGILDRVRALKAIADELGVTRAQLALAWAVSQPGVSSVITGASRLSQLEDNLGALALTLDDEVKARIDTLFDPTLGRA